MLLVSLMQKGIVFMEALFNVPHPVCCSWSMLSDETLSAVGLVLLPIRKG